MDLVENCLALKEKEGTASRDRESFPKKAWADDCLSARLGIFDKDGHVSMVQQQDQRYSVSTSLP